MNGTCILIYTSFDDVHSPAFRRPDRPSALAGGDVDRLGAPSAIGLYLLSFAYDSTTAFAAATIYGLGIVYFWPTMLGVTAERFPRAGRSCWV